MDLPSSVRRLIITISRLVLIQLENDFIVTAHCNFHTKRFQCDYIVEPTDLYRIGEVSRTTDFFFFFSRIFFFLGEKDSFCFSDGCEDRCLSVAKHVAKRTV